MPDDLTPRQLEVFRLLALGHTDKQIGGLLNISYDTVRVHVEALAFRLRMIRGRNTRVLLSNYWWKHHATEQDKAA
jgi:two-component system response regulator NreC